jgi:hypothetical protein
MYKYMRGVRRMRSRAPVFHGGKILQLRARWMHFANLLYIYIIYQIISETIIWDILAQIYIE